MIKVHISRHILFIVVFTAETVLQNSNNLREKSVRTCLKKWNLCSYKSLERVISAL